MQRHGPVIGVGIDIVEVARIEQALSRHGERLLRRLFTAGELADCPAGPQQARRLAARFAAKEAVLKACGRGLRGVRWVEAEIVKDGYGRPHVQLHGALRRLASSLGIDTVLISLTHAREYACAQAVACGRADVARVGSQ